MTAVPVNDPERNPASNVIVEVVAPIAMGLVLSPHWMSPPDTGPGAAGAATTMLK
jgi:hypothetical protein